MPIDNLNIASGVHIVHALTRLKSYYGVANSWVPTGNKYITDTLETISTDLNPGGGVNNQDMVEYIATSAIIHCYNSWSYLTAAVNSYLEGDYGTAVHNAYYSELRSIMSFLAIQGVGVFSTKHIIIDANGVAHKARISGGIKPGTHVFARAAFEQWLTEPANTTKLLPSIRVKGYPLNTWLNCAGFSSLLAGMTSAELIKSWSVDIARLNEEHDLRNFVSYRPQNFNFGIARHSDSLKRRLEMVLSIWDICEPNRFFELLILRKTLDNLNVSQTTKRYSDHEEAIINQLLIDMGIDPIRTGRYIVDFLKRRVKDPDNILLQFATTQVADPIAESDTEPTGILSRACLLLLTITNIVEGLLKTTGTTQSELDKWHESLGIKLGYWEDGYAPSPYSDLWTDIENEISAIKVWLGSQGVNPSVYSFKNSMQQHSSNIRQISKSYFWQTL